MKRSILLLVLSLISVTGFSQVSGLRKVYAYAQESTRGAKPDNAVIDERVSYSIYAEQSGVTKVTFSMAWIKGKAYPVKADRIETPVELKTGEDAGNEKIVLIPATKQKAWAIIPGTLHKKQPSATSALRKLIAKNEVVLVYSWKNKVYYYPVKKIKILPPVVGI